MYVMMYTDVDECAENNGGCSQFATCTNLPGTFNCTCNMEYRGDGFNCSGKIILLSTTSLLWALCLLLCVSVRGINITRKPRDAMPRNHIRLNGSSSTVLTSVVNRSFLYESEYFWLFPSRLYVLNLPQPTFTQNVQTTRIHAQLRLLK